LFNILHRLTKALDFTNPGYFFLDAFDILPIPVMCLLGICTKGGLMPDKPADVTTSEVKITAHTTCEPPAYIKKSKLGSGTGKIH
jgi:hypothetical protein